MSNTEYKPKKYDGYSWTLVKEGNAIEITTIKNKATSEIKNLINEGYKIYRLSPIY